MKKQNYLMAAAGLVLCSAAHAAPAPSNVGAYYVDRDFDSLDMDGFGVSGLLQVPGGLIVPLEYNSTSHSEDGFDFDVDEVRAGAGFSFKASPTVDVRAFAQYVRYNFSFDFLGEKSESDADGVGGFIGLSGKITPSVTAYGTAGYLVLSSEGEDFKAPEATIGINVDFRGPGLFLEYRITKLDSDIEEPIDVKDLRIGVRYNF